MLREASSRHWRRQVEAFALPLPSGDDDDDINAGEGMLGKGYIM